MRATTDKFKINGAPMLAPDADVGFSYEDLDSADSGRDEGGFMHRIPVRYKVGSWSFPYANLTEEEKAYISNSVAGDLRCSYGCNNLPNY